MMDILPEITGVSTSGIFVILVLREVLGFLNRRNGADGKKDHPPEFECSEECKDDMKTLVSLHNRFGEDGLPVWYYPKAPMNQLVKLGEHTNEILMKLLNQVREPTRKMIDND